jgi:ribosomal-protein-alanine N-acetyltransferase
MPMHYPSDEILRTERLTLIRLRPAHVPALIGLWTDPEVTRFLGGPREKASLAAGLEQEARNPEPAAYDLWPLVETATGSVIGHCGLLDKDIEGVAEVELVYVLAVLFWGKGYATEIGSALKRYAVAERGLKRLVSLIDPGNAASERVAMKIGMHLEKEIIRPGGFPRRLFVVEA